MSPSSSSGLFTRRAALSPWSQTPPLVLRPPISRTTPSPSSPSALHPLASTTRFTRSAGIPAACASPWRRRELLKHPVAPPHARAAQQLPRHQRRQRRPPSRPCAPLPHAHSSPTSVTTSVCSSPQAAVRTLEPPNTSSAPTSVGTRLLLMSPRPSWPENPKPRAHSAPFSPTAVVWAPPGGHRHDLDRLKHLCRQKRRYLPALLVVVAQTAEKSPAKGPHAPLRRHQHAVIRSARRHDDPRATELPGSACLPCRPPPAVNCCRRRSTRAPLPSPPSCARRRRPPLRRATPQTPPAAPASAAVTAARRRGPAARKSRCR